MIGRLGYPMMGVITSRRTGPGSVGGEGTSGLKPGWMQSVSVGVCIRLKQVRQNLPAHPRRARVPMPRGPKI